MNLAVGFFDGVHLGHRRILAQADAALTFSDHPAAVFAPERAPALLMTRERRLASIAAALRSNSPRCGSRIVDRVRALDFTPELAKQSPAAFADWLKGAYPELGTLFCGANWTFGAEGAGDAAFLRTRGIQVDVVSYAEYQGLPVSSTRIRAAVAAGEMAAAAEMLGRSWCLEGRVASGKGLGRTLGFPTVNLLPAVGLVCPPLGVYAVRTPWGGGIANYGHAPTMGERAWTEPVLEIHLLRLAVEVSVREGQSVSVEMMRFVRPERKFSSLEELRRQIARDVAACPENVEWDTGRAEAENEAMR